MAGYGDSNQSGWCVFKQISQELHLLMWACPHVYTHRFSFQVALMRRLNSGRGNVLWSLVAPVHSSPLCCTCTVCVWLHVRCWGRQRKLILRYFSCRQSVPGKWTSLPLVNDKFNIFIKQLLTRYFPHLFYFFWFNKSHWCRSRIFIAGSYLHQQFPILLKAGILDMKIWKYEVSLLADMRIMNGDRGHTLTQCGARVLRGLQLHW